MTGRAAASCPRAPLHLRSARVPFSPSFPPAMHLCHPIESTSLNRYWGLALATGIHMHRSRSTPPGILNCVLMLSQCGTRLSSQIVEGILLTFDANMNSNPMQKRKNNLQRQRTGTFIDKLVQVSSLLPLAASKP